MPDLARMSLWLNLKTVGALIAIVVSGAFAVGVLLTNVQRDVREVAGDLAAAKAIGVERWQRVTADMQSVDRQQAAEIAALRQQAEAQALSSARTETKLNGIEAGVARLLSIMDRPAGR